MRAFDGQGREGLFTITDLAKDRVGLSPVSLGETPPPANGIVLAPGFSRSARRDFFLEKAVELGAAGILFWQAERSQGRLPETAKDAWAATLVAAAKQCGAARLPELAVIPAGAAGLVAVCRQRFARRFFLWEEAGCPRRLTLADLSGPGQAVFVLGPEGGFTDAEVVLFQDAGFVPVSLGPRVLRWETAALAVLALGLAAPQAANPAAGRAGD